MSLTAETSIAHVSAVVPVFNDSERALNAVASLCAQKLPPGGSLEIIVVDDGSADAARAVLRRSLPTTVRLVELAENRGRSAARQAGIDAARGDAVLFFDCDCKPEDERFVFEHLAAIASGAIASVGPIVGCDGGFWDRYQRETSRRRQEMFERGIHYVGSTSNMLVRSHALQAVGGFDARYRNYGFEDRDLLIRLATCGEIRWSQHAVVLHLDRLTMASVSAKMRAAGVENSSLFAAQHADAYRALGYASVDAKERVALRWLGRAVGRLLPSASRAFDALERHRLLPWPLAFLTARALSAASFLAGTADPKRREQD